MYLLVFFGTIATLGTLWYWTYRWQFKFADKWPSVRPRYAIVGNALIMLWKNDVQRFQEIKRVFSECDRILTAWAGPKMFLITSHPDIVHQILSSPDCLERPFLYRFAGFTQGIFTAKLPVWKDNRKRLNSTFNQRIVHGFVPYFVKCCEKMTKSLLECADGETVNIQKYTAVCALEMAAGTTLGGDVLQQGDGKEEFKRGLDLAFNGASRRMVTVPFYSDLIYQMTHHYKELMEGRRIICDFFTKLLIERKKFLLDHSKNTDVDTEEEYNKPKILVDQLLGVSHDGRQFNDIQIRDNVYAVITGATDTTSLATAHACLFLSFYPDIQERLHAELAEVFPGNIADYTPENIKKLTYLDMFINEVQRHCTVVPYVARENTAEIEIDGVKVPPGNIFIMSLYAMHKRPDIWGPDAEKFDPENFTEERIKDRHPAAFLPYSAGSKNCLGWRYAIFGMKLIMIHLVRNFHFSSKIKHEDMQFRHDLTLKLPFQHLVQLKKRNPGKILTMVE
ncbi:AAEL005695-PA [Aedes aegypti]|uniref:AAEL005695-PA n=2 Tax=Aedes aegypti TaxID=7159 RepID=A0A1S4FB96_AEDAE|nr:probable cytochrome P450 313a4 [Aedes aegypti]EAT42800.1 AAEL005695-PA [Aedes aegypti]